MAGAGRRVEPAEREGEVMATVIKHGTSKTGRSHMRLVGTCGRCKAVVEFRERETWGEVAGLGRFGVCIECMCEMQVQWEPKAVEAAAKLGDK